ncbi:glycosyltransferase family 4 protein [Candidatus Pacearchaeota archaeon]|nr:glycosyltransferase family 4 protein [Candidatus Pacearchaeota archaeon]
MKVYKRLKKEVIEKKIAPKILKFFYSLVEAPIKVGIISYYYPYEKPSTSGVGIHVYNLANTLAKFGAEVHVFTHGEVEDIKNIKIDGKKIILHLLNGHNKRGNKYPSTIIEKRLKYVDFENRVLNEFILENSKRSFSIIHTHGWLTTSAFRIKYLLKIPWIHTVHALERKRVELMSNEEKELIIITSWVEDTIKYADKIIVVSNSLRKELLKEFDIDKNSIEVIPNGVRLDYFKPKRKNEKRQLKILSITRFSKEKGISLFPKIIDRILLKNNKLKFILVAPETKTPSLEKIQKKFNYLVKKYKGRFQWVSHPLNIKKIAKLYQESDIYIQPSKYESFGLCILEAMASGNVIIASNTGGIPDVVNKSGILIVPNAKVFIKEISKLINNKDKIKRLSELSILRSYKFSWDKIGKRTLSLYKEVINHK